MEMAPLTSGSLQRSSVLEDWFTPQSTPECERRKSERLGEVIGRESGWREEQECPSVERIAGERTGREDKNQCVNRGRNHLCDQLKT